MLVEDFIIYVYGCVEDICCYETEKIRLPRVS
jgi:hypothetical protein